MDEFYEFLVKKKSSGFDNLLKLWIVIIAVILCVAIMTFFPMWGRFMSGIVFIAMALVVYVMYHLIMRINAEYEFSFSNGVLDVDVIRGKRSRKRLASFHCRDIACMAAKSNGEKRSVFMEKKEAHKIICLCDYKKDFYRLLFQDEKGEHILFFQPPAKLLNMMKTYNPHKIFLKPEDVEKEEA